MQFRKYEEVARLIHRALEHGAIRVDDHLHVFEWNVGAWCDDPVHTDVVGREDHKSKKAAFRVNPKTITIRLSGLPCRRCERCLRVRAAEWKSRAMTELSRSRRTWFCTLTMSPDWQHRVFMEEMALKNRRGWLDGDFETPETEFLLRCHGGLKLVTKFWKTVRHTRVGEEPVRLKYMTVAERHISGLPHYHALVHEGAGNLTYRRLESRWLQYGFFHAKLVHDEGGKHAGYVTKYLSKDMLARVRASQRYGLQSQDALGSLWAAAEDLWGPLSLNV